MKDILLVLAGAVGLFVVEVIAVVAVAIRRLVKEGKISGQNSRERMRETVVPVLKEEP